MRHLLLTALIIIPVAAWGQSSANFTVATSSFNSGGSPGEGSSPTSASYHSSVVSIGENISATTMSSTSFLMDIGFAAFNRPPVAIFSDGFEGADALDSTEGISSEKRQVKLKTQSAAVATAIAIR